MNEATRFLVRCRLTCFGGSEKGTCPCPGVYQCEERENPLFSKYRFEAQRRMARYLENGVQAPSVTEEKK